MELRTMKAQYNTSKSRKERLPERVAVLVWKILATFLESKFGIFNFIYIELSANFIINSKLML